MNLKQLRTFCAVVDAGNARLAAERLYVAPTAVSMQLGQLEESLGGRLFDRGSRPMGLTALGQYVLPKARELLAAADRLQAEARGIAAGNLGWLSIGFTRSTIFSVLPEAVRAMQADCPGVHIELKEILTEPQPASLRDGTIHVGLARVLGGFHREPDLEYLPLFDDPLVAALPVDHPLAARERIAAAELEPLPYISFPKDAHSHFSRQVLLLLQEAGARPQVVHEAKEIHTALGLVAAGQGATVVGRSVGVNNRPDIRFVPIADVQVPSQVLAVRVAGKTLPLGDAFLQRVRAAGAAIDAPRA